MRCRRGFTLIELMVAMALTLFIMVILSQAFILSLDTFSALKGVGDMQAGLRSAVTALRSDLGAQHFDGNVRLSQLSSPPQEGFLYIRQGSAQGVGPYLNEGLDADGVGSFRAIDHILHFSVRLQGNGQENFFTTPIDPTNVLSAGVGGGLDAFYNQCKVFDFMTADQAQDAMLNPLVYDRTRGKTAPPFMFRSQWAEVAYFLVQTGSTVEINNPASAVGTPLFGLYRAQLVSTPYVSDLNNKATTNKSMYRQMTRPFFGMSCNMAALNVANWVPSAPFAGGAPPAVGPHPVNFNPLYPYVLTFYSPADLANNGTPYAATAGNIQLPTRRGLDFVSHSRVPASGAEPAPTYFGFNAAVAAQFDKTQAALVTEAVLDTVGAKVGGPLQYTTMSSFRTMMASSLVLANVLSFHVQVMPANPSSTTTWQDVNGTTPFAANIGAIYDTANIGSANPFVSSLTGLSAIRVTLRMWDPRSQQARQATVIQDF